MKYQFHSLINYKKKINRESKKMKMIELHTILIYSS